MEKYEKRIKYLDYMEYGSKIKNGGFIRTEMQGEKCRVQIGIKGLYPTDTLEAEVFLLSGRERRKVDTLMLHYGTGDYAAVWNTYNLADSGTSYAEWTGILISVSEHRLLENEWGELPENLQEAEMGLETNPEPEPEIEVELKGEEETEEPELKGEEEPEFEPERLETFMAEYESRERFAGLYEDKWMQLEQYYKKIRPFGDKKTYLSITPGDFIVLDEQYQKLVSNSFLLHGYYNYGHLVLTRREMGEGFQYYLGVPGIYHEREKQVAGMFGFEGFEGAAERNAEGGFGYYMLQVEI
ncbi:MAG: hypothetical protein IJ282_09705 [Lachnospiraceae bacterium]|nr:hypothetical protein [Lachnospiraceae bacterium]